MNPLGNPVARRKGQVVRALIMSLVNAKRPMPMAEVMQLTGRARTTVLDHCALLQEKGRIAGYTSAGGLLRVWTEDRE